jgi:hypothetical protein
MQQWRNCLEGVSILSASRLDKETEPEKVRAIATIQVGQSPLEYCQALEGLVLQVEYR